MEAEQAIAGLAGRAYMPSPDRVLSRSATSTALKIIVRLEDLASYTPDIEDLARNLETQNVAYEPWALFPLLNASYSKHRRFVFILIFEEGLQSGPRLIAFFPFERTALHPLVPISYLRLWADPFNYLNARCDPLIRKGYMNCVDILLELYASGQLRASLLNLRGLTDGDGPRFLQTRLQREKKNVFVHNTCTSHLYRRHPNANSYFSSVFSSKSLQTLRRYERRLRDLGSVEYAEGAECADITGLVDEFLDLEHQGWKGRKGVSVVSYGHRDQVKEILEEAHRRKRLSLLTLRVSGKLVAARCVFLAKPGSFLFKLTYDESESFAKRSPGLLLELEAIRRLHADGPQSAGIDWMDTCASPYSSIFNRSRSEALTIHRFLIARRGTLGALVLLGIPMIGKMRSVLQRLRSAISQPKARAE